MKKLISIALVLVMVTALCVCPALAAGGNGDGSGGGGGNAPLSVVSVTIDGVPLNGAETGPDGVITISFDRGMNKNSDTTAAAISITGADATVAFDGDRTFTVSFSGLASGSYALVIGAAAKANNGNTLGTDYTAVFTVKEAAPAPTDDPTGRFTDVQDPDTWFYDAVYYCVGIGLVKGMPDRSFAPAKNMNMAELTQLLYRMAGNEDAEGEYWWSAAENWAVAAGIITEEEFKPAENVTREFFFRMFCAAAADTGKFDMTPRADIAAAVDYDQIDDANHDAISWAVAAGMVEGTSATSLKIDPDFDMNRATACVIIMRYFES